MITSLKKGLAALTLTLGLVSNAQAALIDIELSLVIDVSGSVSTSEYNLQLDGYAQAFRDSSVIQNILDATHGIAVNAVFFSGNFFSTSLDAFTTLQTEADSLAFADVLDNFVRPGGGGTNIYTGTNRAIDLLLANGLDATVGTVIDVSGDGTDTASLNQQARDRAVAEGFTVNGIAIGGPSITDFYRDNVIGGPGSFVIEATDFSDFEAGIINKLRIETQVNPDPNPIPTPGVLILFLSGLALLVVRRVK